jgi:CTP:molybdopterin cytidylyltransferase MocA
MRTAGLILAAGEGKRFGGPKAPAVINGQRLIDSAVQVLEGARCSPIYAVLGAWVGDVPGAEIILNEQWSEGMGSSLRVGLTHLIDTDVDRVLVTLVDLPGLTASACERVLAAPGGLVAATYDGVRGHPVLFARSHWPAVIDTARGDEGARMYLRGRTDITLIEVGDVASGEDLDLPIDGDKRRM